IKLILGPSVFNRYVLALDIASLLQAPTKSAQSVHEPVRRSGVEKPNHRHRGLLRPRRDRPRCRRTAEQRDELASPHSITSSARPESGSGKVRPSALAVLRLMTSSTFVDCWTGRSAGLVPLRIRPV